MAISSVEVVAASGLVSVIMMVGAWGRADAPREWVRTLVGVPYRDQAPEAKAPVPRAVRIAVPVAWVVAVICMLRALVLALEILSMERIRGAGSVNCSSFPCEPSGLPIGLLFDAETAAVAGIHMIASATALGAFARWARGASSDMNQARRLMPLAAGGILVLFAVASGPHRDRFFGHVYREYDPMWLMTLIQIGVVVIGLVAIAIARREAPPLAE